VYLCWFLQGGYVRVEMLAHEVCTSWTSKIRSNCLSVFFFFFSFYF
jgi:hypothetical protein